MTFHELFTQPPFKEFFEEVERFVRCQLDDYNNRLEKTDLSTQGKEIFDAVWGNIEFSAGEIYILDSPLLQRLRRIKQLGLAHFVYCGSSYSRFYHTTGVVYLADRMAASLNKTSEYSKERQNYFKSTVRLAAIFHDTGHMFLSHVSEHYFSKSPLYPRYEVINEALETFERRARKSIALHELLSCMIVNTEGVRRLLKRVGNILEGNLTEQDENMDKLVDYISGLITGVPVDGWILPYSSIINGEIDADKCDYLSRDSHVTRVPVAVDISRLTQKLCVVKTEDINRSDLWRTDRDAERSYYVLAMSDSAEKALFQLCIARTIMFDSVYYHHKVLTAETEMRGLINKLANLDVPVFCSFDEILNYSDDDINYYFFQSLNAGRGEKDKERIQEVAQEWAQICNRIMAKRIACIMPEFISGTQSAKENLFDNVLTNLNSDQELALISKVHSQYAEICRLLEITPDSDDINIFVIQPPNILYGHSKIQVPISLNNGNKREFRGYELVNSRETSSSASYVVTDAAQKHLVYLALEKVLYKDYKIILKDESSTCGKFIPDQAAKHCGDLFERSYYDDVPELINRSVLDRYISKKQIQEIQKKFSVYEGPDNYHVDEKSICCFFQQILSACPKKENCRDITEGIYWLLIKAIFLDRKYIAIRIESILKRISLTGEELSILPLGNSRDSAQHLTYYFNDVHIDCPYSIMKNLPEILMDENRKDIGLFDDASYSGKQLISIMQEYMGVSGEERTTTENHVEPLEDALREKLKEKNLVFAFLAFNPSNKENTEKALQKLGLKNISFVYAEDIGSPLLEGESEIFASKEQQRLVREFLSSVGYEILKSQKCKDGVYKDRWDEERVRNSALGYNNAQQMVILKDSIPTYTITAFWQQGVYGGREWLPLFRRTQKD